MKDKIKALGEGSKKKCTQSVACQHVEEAAVMQLERSVESELGATTLPSCAPRTLVLTKLTRPGELLRQRSPAKMSL